MDPGAKQHMRLCSHSCIVRQDLQQHAPPELLACSCGGLKGSHMALPPKVRTARASQPHWHPLISQFHFCCWKTWLFSLTLALCGSVSVRPVDQALLCRARGKAGPGLWWEWGRRPALHMGQKHGWEGPTAPSPWGASICWPTRRGQEPRCQQQSWKSVISPREATLLGHCVPGAFYPDHTGEKHHGGEGKCECWLLCARRAERPSSVPLPFRKAHSALGVSQGPVWYLGPASVLNAVSQIDATTWVLSPKQHAVTTASGTDMHGPGRWSSSPAPPWTAVPAQRLPCGIAVLVLPQGDRPQGSLAQGLTD